MNIQLTPCFRCNKQANQQDIQPCGTCKRWYCSTCWGIPSNREGLHNHKLADEQ